MSCGLPNLLDGADGLLPPLVGFDHAVRITRPVPDPTPQLDEWNQPQAGSEPTVLVVYDGPADVQVRPVAALRDRYGDAALNAGAEAFLPPGAADAFAAARLDDAVETPFGPARVAGRRETERALLLTFTERPA